VVAAQWLLCDKIRAAVRTAVRDRLPTLLETPPAMSSRHPNFEHLFVLGLLLSTKACDKQQHLEQAVFAPDERWPSKYGPQIDLPYTSPITSSHLLKIHALDDPSIHSLRYRNAV